MATNCTGDCLKCNVVQRQYCSAQITYNNMRMMEQMSETIKEIQDEIKNLKEKEPTDLINPIE